MIFIIYLSHGEGRLGSINPCNDHELVPGYSGCTRSDNMYGLIPVPVELQVQNDLRPIFHSLLPISGSVSLPLQH